MVILEIGLGELDYGRKQMARITILGVTIMLGHDFLNWFALHIDADWGRGYYGGWGALPKRYHGDQFFEMLLRRFAPGWMHR